MKIRIRRFWMSISLAIGSLATPAGGWLMAHDLPTRMSSGADSSSWSYLLDECLDTPVWYDTAHRSLLAPACMLTSPLASITSVPPASQPPRGLIASDELIDECLSRQMDANGCVEDFDAMLSRYSLARYKNEMSGWVSNWDRLQKQAGEAVRRDLGRYRDSAGEATAWWAATPVEALPPAPSDEYRNFAVANKGTAATEELGDTCAFDAEYQAMQAAAELLAGNQSPRQEVQLAEESSDLELHDDTLDYEALGWALASAEAVEAAAIDTLAADTLAADTLAADTLAADTLVHEELVHAEVASSYPFGDLTADMAAYLALDSAMDSATDSASDESRCGGLTPEILTQASEAARSAFGPSRFAPGIVDEFMLDELSQTDTHWLGGLGKAWRLQAAVRSASAPEYASSPERLSEAIAQAMIAPEDWMPPASVTAHDATVVGYDSSVADQNSVGYENPVGFEATVAHENRAEETLAWLAEAASAQLESQLSIRGQQAAHAIDGWRRWAEFSYQAARFLSAPIAHDATSALPELRNGIEQSLVWIEDMQCLATAQLCGFDGAYTIGNQLGDIALVTTQQSLANYVAMGAYLDLPLAIVDPNPELFVIYTDIDGSETAVPASLARAWNRPAPDEQMLSTNATAEIASMDALTQGEELPDPQAAIEPLDLVAIQSELLVLVARQLDAIGIACFQTADELSNWADNQIASRNATSNR